MKRRAGLDLGQGRRAYLALDVSGEICARDEIHHPFLAGEKCPQQHDGQRDHQHQRRPRQQRAAPCARRTARQGHGLARPCREQRGDVGRRVEMTGPRAVHVLPGEFEATVIEAGAAQGQRRQCDATRRVVRHAQHQRLTLERERRLAAGGRGVGPEQTCRPWPHQRLSPSSTLPRMPSSEPSSRPPPPARGA